MGMSFLYGKATDEDAIAVIHRSLDLGMTFLDTAEVYGPYANEELVGRALKGRRDQAVVATKFGFKIENGAMSGVDGSPENVRRACDASLQRLGIDTIDLFYQHRPDRSVPIEETVGAMAELVKAGQGQAPGPVRSRVGAGCAAPTPSTPSRPCKANTRSGSAASKPTSCRPCANSASAWSPTARWGAAS